MASMGIKLDKEQLYIRELTESEKSVIDSAVMATPMMMCPDNGKITETGEEVKVTHAYFSQDGLNYGIEYADGKYSIKNSSEVELLNPKFNWKHIAERNDKR